MNIGRLSSLALGGLLGGIMVWAVTRPPDETDVPEPLAASMQSSATIADAALQSRERRIEELAAELAESQRLLDETRTALAASQAELTLRAAETEMEQAREAARTERFGVAYVDFARQEWDSQSVDPDWATAVEAEISQTIYERSSDVGLQITGFEIECRTDICRLHVTHATSPVDERTFAALGDRMRQLESALINSSSSLSAGTVNNRTRFSGEVTSSEVFLFIDESKGSMIFYETPNGRHIFAKAIW